MIMPGTPTHPRAKPESLSPTQILMAAMPISNIPTPADAVCLRRAWLRIGPWRKRISNRAMRVRLNRQLPKRVPMAKSGRPTRAAELTPVTSSGTEVMAASSTRPIHSPPTPVFSPIASPYRASLVPANRMMARQATYCNQTRI